MPKAGRSAGTTRVGGVSLPGGRLVVMSALLFVGLGVSGCSSSGAGHPSAHSGTSAPSQTHGSVASAGCGTVPAARVKAALGIAVSPPTTNKAGNAVACEYAGGGNPMQVIIRIENGSTLAEMQSLRKSGDANAGVKSKDLPGLGDGAYTTSLSVHGLPTVNTVAAQKGQLNIQVTAPASLSAIKALVAQLIA
jgi:hypothetical protein